MARWDSGGYEFGFKLGSSVQYFFWKGVYVEGGLDLVFSNVGQYNANNNPRLYMKPTIAIGRQHNLHNETGLRLPGTGLPRLRSNVSKTEEK
jgi:hypothetical protein